jgi:hypothetical protein
VFDGSSIIRTRSNLAPPSNIIATAIEAAAKPYSRMTLLWLLALNQRKNFSAVKHIMKHDEIVLIVKAIDESKEVLVLKM